MPALVAPCREFLGRYVHLFELSLSFTRDLGPLFARRPPPVFVENEPESEFSPLFQISVFHFLANVIRTWHTIIPRWVRHPLLISPSHGQRFPKAKNRSIAMSSDSSSSGNTRPRAGLRRPKHPRPSRAPPHPILPHTGKHLQSLAWLLVDPPKRPPRFQTRL